MAGSFEFCLLGPLVVRCDGLVVPVPGAKPRAVLAALLLNAGELVTVDKLAEVLWGADPPPSARVSVQNHVKRLRHALGEVGRTRIATRPGGYVMRLKAGELDVYRFQNSLARAQAAARERSWEQAAAQASAALELWRGEPLADAGSGLLAERAVPYLAEIRLQAWETRLEAEVQLGHHAAAVIELHRLTAAYPLREHLHALLMLALQRFGRQGEALAAYQAARQILIDELGADPGSELRQVHRQILDGDADMAAAQKLVAPTADTRRTTVPRQLPAAVRDFIGREAELATLTSLLGHAVISTPATLVISAIGGTAGIGKTALAVHWAHQVADQFPDGQLYINLRGFHPSRKPMPSAEAARALLNALGVPAQRIPASPDAQAALNRSLLSGKRMLILLDNARDVGQVRPLLPGSPGCLVVVTSRSQLSGLIAIEGAYALALEVLTEAEARELLARRLGEARLEAEPDAAAKLIGLCARLPLALAIAAARASGRPGLRLSALAAELADSRHRLDALDAGDAAASVRAVFSWSLDSLTPPAKRLFALIGLHPGPDITIPVAASLGGMPPGRASQALGELTEAQLLAERSANRYAMHDLLRAYAAEQARAAGDSGSREAIDRLLSYYVHTGRAAALLLNPARETLRLAASALPPGVSPDPLADRAQALAWYEAEYKNVLAAVEQAAGTGFDTEACLLAWSLADFVDRRGNWHDWVIAQQAALGAAVRLGDRALQVRTERALGRAYTEIGALGEAEACLRRALDRDRHPGDAASRASTHLALARVLEYRDRFGQCLEHARHALGLYQEAGDTAGQARTLNGIGWFQVRLGHHQDAIGSCEQALSLYRRTEDRRGKATTCDSLGFAHHHLGQHAQAIACYQQAVESFQEIGERPNLAETLTHLGDSYHALGDVDQAQITWQQALAVLDGLSPDDAAQVWAKLEQLGRLRMSTPDPGSRQSRLGRAFTLRTLSIGGYGGKAMASSELTEDIRILIARHLEADLRVQNLERELELIAPVDVLQACRHGFYTLRELARVLTDTASSVLSLMKSACQG